MSKSVLDFIRDGWSKEQAEILVVVAQATDEWLTNNPVELSKRPEFASLRELAERYDKRFELRKKIADEKDPRGFRYGASRTAEAMNAVISGGVHRLQDVSGVDSWWVGGHVCSKSAGTCSCKDYDTYDDSRLGGTDGKMYGRLCWHRLAVILKTNWHGDENPALMQFIESCLEKSSGLYFDLLVTRVGIYDLYSSTLPTVAGYWVHGMSAHKRVSPSDEIPFTLPQFQNALDKLGLKLLQLPEKLPGWTDYYYRLAKASDGLVITEQVFNHRGMTWKMEDRERMRKFDMLQIAILFEEYVNSVKLSEYEAKRVLNLRAQIKNGEIKLSDLFDTVPSEVLIGWLEKMTE